MRDQQDSPKWMELSQLIEEELDLFPAIELLAPDILFEATSFKAVDQALIRTCIQELKAQASNLTRWRTWFTTRRSTVWYPEYEAIYQALFCSDRSIRAKTSLRHWLSAIRPPAV